MPRHSLSLKPRFLDTSCPSPKETKHRISRTGSRAGRFEGPRLPPATARGRRHPVAIFGNLSLRTLNLKSLPGGRDTFPRIFGIYCGRPEGIGPDDIFEGVLVEAFCPGRVLPFEEGALEGYSLLMASNLSLGRN